MAEYGEVVVTFWYGPNGHEMQVDQAPDRVLMSVELLQQMHHKHIAGPDRIFAGLDLTERPASREPVWYRIVGWDSEAKALIIERERDEAAEERAKRRHQDHASATEPLPPYPSNQLTVSGGLSQTGDPHG